VGSSSPLLHCSVSDRIIAQVTKGKTGDKSQARGTHINDDTFVEQALLLGSHDKVVGTVLVVNNVLKIDS
jgi:hypothetical protein